jgi:hypothetical protein
LLANGESIQLDHSARWLLNVSAIQDSVPECSNRSCQTLKSSRRYIPPPRPPPLKRRGSAWKAPPLQRRGWGGAKPAQRTL